MINSLKEFKPYQKSLEFGEKIWDVVDNWNFFQKDTIGKQLIRATDSIAANLSEGLGRFHFKETRNFGYYARGSLFECKTWLTKAVNRKLIEKVVFEMLIAEAEVLGKMINTYTNSIGQANEPIEPYGESESPNTQSLILNP